MNKDLKQFLDWLKENDRSEEEKMQCKLLDEYPDFVTQKCPFCN